jgi:acetyl-CoA carboxylase alpha subunit
LEAIVKEAVSVNFNRYSIVILDAKDGALLDYSRLGGLDPEEARSIIWKTYNAINHTTEAGGLVEADIITESGYMKIIVEQDAGIIRGIVTLSGADAFTATPGLA